MDSQPTSSDAYTQSDTDKSGQQVFWERQCVVSEKMEESANSLHEINVGASGNAAKKTGSVKIKTSKELGSSVNHSTDPVPARTESPHKRESKEAGQDSRYNKQELDTALTDYFDVIDTPMDFGTICSNLEEGRKYNNSEDVFRDVEYIWNNCYKYNSKGDYILDLMRRVKKKFTKYWTAAGLYNGQPRGTNGECFNDKDKIKSKVNSTRINFLV
ncbi:bromodomain-containing factor 1-like [Pyrus x bretschneideri]|uniref:bromodomain-containing factor 1-like n=1 Tax=Pyrus x bretschneideri TaxID=225117 RepID=UPI00202E21B8|nr:bromodomain-containing factor 1-like [Pyrus x bretschneideri]